MRSHRFAEGEYYHIYVHSVENARVFGSRRYCDRFLTALFAANIFHSLPRMDRGVSVTSLASDIKKSGYSARDKPLAKIIAFCVMPTHIHLLMRENGEGNISILLHQALTSHAKYYNAKTGRRGHVFESTFHSRHIGTNEYLLVVSSYIHKNPHSIGAYLGREEEYPWSSYQDYISENRWGDFLEQRVVLGQFGTRHEYRRFVEEHYQDYEHDTNASVSYA